MCKNIRWHEHCFIMKLLGLKLFWSGQAKEAEGNRFWIQVLFKHKSITISTKHTEYFTPTKGLVSQETMRGQHKTTSEATPQLLFITRAQSPALPASFPGWRSQTPGTLPTELLPSSRAAQPQSALSQIWSELSQFLLPDQCHQLSTGHIPTKFQDLNKVDEIQMT